MNKTLFFLLLPGLLISCKRISPARIIDYPQVGIPILNFCRTDQGFALLNFDGPERIAFIDTCGHLLNKKYEIS